MSETTGSEIITGGEYLRDLENTRAELEAYQQLAAAYRTLASLPEQEDVDRRMYHFRSRDYTSKAVRCKEFLDELEALKAVHEPAVGEAVWREMNDSGWTYYLADVADLELGVYPSLGSEWAFWAVSRNGRKIAGGRSSTTEDAKLAAELMAKRAANQ